MEQPYRVNALIVKGVGMLPGASAEYTSQSMKVQHKNNNANPEKRLALLYYSACKIMRPALRRRRVLRRE